MKSIVRGFALIFAFVFMIRFLSIEVIAMNLTASNNLSKTFIITGLDDSSKHTDVIAIVNYKRATNSITVFRIPRDTYYNFGKSQNKINQITAVAISEGAHLNEAILAFEKCIAEQFSISSNGIISFTVDAFERVLNLIGDIKINCDKDYILRGRNGNTLLSLSKGEHVLSPSQSVLIVRHRYGYLRGDLDRIEMQTILFEGVFKSVLQNDNLITLTKEILKTKGVFTDISFSDLIAIIFAIRDIKRSEMKSLIIPGESKVSSSGVWYYILDRYATVNMLSQYYSVTENSFDIKRNFEYKS